MEKLHTPQSRWWDWAAIGLLFILLQTVASRLVATAWTPFLSLTQMFTSMGFVIGAALGYSLFPRRITYWLNVIYLLLLVPLQWTRVIDQNASLEEQIVSVGGRLFFSISSFIARQPVDDPLFFVAIMSIAFWIISSLSSFALVRNQNYLGAVLPAAIGLLIIQNYDGRIASRLWFLAFFGFVALLLLGRLHFLQNKQVWRARHIFVSPDNIVDLTSSMAVAAGLIILIAWTVPASASSVRSAVQTWNRLTQPWREFTERIENAVSALESPANRPTEFFGSQLALGRGFSLSDTLMFEVEAEGVSPQQKPPRYYWRGRSYDRFADGQWRTTGTVREEYSPGATNPYNVNMQEAQPASFTFKTGASNFSLLYAPSQPIWISRPGVTFTLPTDAGRDIVAWHAFPSLRGGEIYQLDAVLSNPNRQQLQEAGANYPEWVTAQYLQLPQNFSPRIRALAQEITAGATTPYEKASAITSYLRENIEYSETIAAPPRNRDPLEWILFDYKRAYCVYYASADVLMLRSVGVPARMAVGFTQGERDGNTYVVRRYNAHAWPEVYFPGIGWVEFEPTAGQAPLSRPLPPQDELGVEGGILDRDPTLRDDQVEPFGSDMTNIGGEAPAQQNDWGFRPIFLIPLLALFAGLAIVLMQRFALHTRLPGWMRSAIERSGMDVPLWILRWENWVKLSPIEKSFESINIALRRLGQPVPVHATPAERAETLRRILPDTADQIKILLDEHQTSLYTFRSADVAQARQAAYDIRRHSIRKRIRSLLLGRAAR